MLQTRVNCVRPAATRCGGWNELDRHTVSNVKLGNSEIPENISDISIMRRAHIYKAIAHQHLQHIITICAYLCAYYSVIFARMSVTLMASKITQPGFSGSPSSLQSPGSSLPGKTPSPALKGHLSRQGRGVKAVRPHAVIPAVPTAYSLQPKALPFFPCQNRHGPIHCVVTLDPEAQSQPAVGRCP
jgi:hypothetical protein